LASLQRSSDRQPQPMHSVRPILSRSSSAMRSSMRALHPRDRRDWSRLSRGWSARVDDRIAELERLKIGLTECIGCGCLSLERCKLANPGDRASGLGPGPRYWVGDRPLGG